MHVIKYPFLYSYEKHFSICSIPGIWLDLGDINKRRHSSCLVEFVCLDVVFCFFFVKSVLRNWGDIFKWNISQVISETWSPSTQKTSQILCYRSNPIFMFTIFIFSGQPQIFWGITCQLHLSSTLWNPMSTTIDVMCDQ